MTDSPESLRDNVREFYGKVAEDEACGCAPTCCGQASNMETPPTPSQMAARLGYTPEQIGSDAAAGNFGLGCGNPLAIASLKPGDVVMDLGSGAGFDSFLAAAAVGPNGKVIGVDMTAAMLAKARRNAERGGYGNVDFRLGEIENLPVADNSVDVILSNCVINLSPNKLRVFQESFRVLKPGGRLAISDIVALAPIPEELKKDKNLYCGCATGASLISDLEQMLKTSGFASIRITPKAEAKDVIKEWFPGRGIENLVSSATIEAVKLV